MGVQAACLCGVGGEVEPGWKAPGLSGPGWRVTLWGGNLSKEPMLRVSVHLWGLCLLQPDAGLQRRHTFHPDPTPSPK